MRKRLDKHLDTLEETFCKNYRPKAGKHETEINNSLSEIESKNKAAYATINITLLKTMATDVQLFLAIRLIRRQPQKLTGCLDGTLVGYESDFPWHPRGVIDGAGNVVVGIQKSNRGGEGHGGVKETNINVFPTYKQKEQLSTLEKDIDDMINIVFNSVLLKRSAEWGYYQRGVPPSFWHCLEGNEMCNSKRQSPVDIKTKGVVKNNRIVPFDFSDLEDTERVKMEMRNNGHAVIIDFPDRQPLIKRGGLQEPLQLNELHFHWGSNSQWGSEHTINGHRYAMEVHFDFVTTGNGPVELRAVISVLIYINAFRALVGTQSMFEYNIVDTFRPVQPLWQRKVTLSCPRMRNYEITVDFDSNDRCINHGWRGKSQKKI
ncbi:CA4 [Mytilus edulis]|uniref:carbonic anhydrase n=1 Tax=Mytilus edulis TaxID=6550 RepID=A0A8S3S6S2_MYTED|nr:CA4 [Mytilus edulis]